MSHDIAYGSQTHMLPSQSTHHVRKAPNGQVVVFGSAMHGAVSRSSTSFVLRSDHLLTISAAKKNVHQSWTLATLYEQFTTETIHDKPPGPGRQHVGPDHRIMCTCGNKSDSCVYMTEST